MERVFHGLYYGREKGRNYVGDDHAHRTGDLAPQRAGQGVDLVAHLAGRGENPLASIRPHGPRAA